MMALIVNGANIPNVVVVPVLLAVGRVVWGVLNGALHRTGVLERIDERLRKLAPGWRDPPD